MLTLAIIDHNPAGSIALAWFGAILLALVAATVVGVWIVVVLGARQAIEDPGERVEDPGLKGLRRRSLVVKRSQRSRGPQAAVVSELEPDADRRARTRS